MSPTDKCITVEDDA